MVGFLGTGTNHFIFYHTLVIYQYPQAVEIQQILESRSYLEASQNGYQ